MDEKVWTNISIIIDENRKKPNYASYNNNNNIYYKEMPNDEKLNWVIMFLIKKL